MVIPVKHFIKSMTDQSRSNPHIDAGIKMVESICKCVRSTVAQAHVETVKYHKEVSEAYHIVNETKI